MRMKQGMVARVVTLLVMIVVCSCGKATDTPTNTPTNTPTATPTSTPTPRCCQGTLGALCSDEAWNHIGENRAVEFCVGRTYNSGSAVFLDSCADYKGHFYIPVFPEYWGCWSEPPETHFYGHCVVVQGDIQIYQGSPEIILRACDLIRDLGPCNPATDSCK